MAVVESIFAHARTAPDRRSVVYNGRALSYRAFAACIGVTQRFLARQQVGPQAVAALCIHNALDAWIIGLALRRLGVTTVQVRSAEDVARLGLPAIRLVSTEADPWPGLEAAAERGTPTTVVPADLFTPPSLAQGAEEAPAAAAEGGHILLTSGTTGAYKKVLFSAAAAARNLAQRRHLYGADGASVVNVLDFGGWTSIGYHWPSCVWEVGGAVVIHQGRERWRSLATPGITHTVTHPELLEDLLAAPANIDLRNDAMALIVTAGALSPAQWRRARERLSRDVRTGIGSTEAGVVTVTSIETADDLAWHRVDPDCGLEVVDDDDRPLPAGHVGRVRIRTIGVDVYMDDADATRACFRDGYFYPGDLAVLRDDGRLSLQGRVTEVINVMGSKIAAGPLEAQLEARLGARAVCVFSAPSAAGEVVHIAIQPGQRLAPDELGTALAATLPGVEQIRVHVVATFPRNELGKIERATLRSQLLSRPARPHAPNG